MDQAEALRNVIKKQNLEARPNARIITITSGKGGVGKSNTAVNLAVQFRKMGMRVIIFDADFGLANVEVMFGAIPRFNLSDLIYGEKTIRDIITEGPMGIGFISGGSGISGMENLTKGQIVYLIKCLNELNDLADVIIVDTGAGISDSVLEFVLASPEVLVVTTPDPSSLTDAYSLLKVLYANPNFRRDETKLKIVANKASSIEEAQAVFNKLESVVLQFLQGDIEYLGMIPQDSELEMAVRQQKIVSMSAPNSKSAKSFEVLASNLIHHEHKEVRMKWGVAQLFSYFIARRS